MHASTLTTHTSGPHYAPNSRPVGDFCTLPSTLSYPSNAYFSLTIHAIPANWRRVAVVTSEFHMPRTKALFDSIWRLAGQSVYNDPHR
jgi:hypothetical protein